MNLAEQAAAIFRQCTHYNMITGEGFVARRFMSHQRGAHPYVLARSSPAHMGSATREDVKVITDWIKAHG